MQTLLGPIPPQKKVGRRRFASVPHSPALSGSTGALCHGARFFARRLTLLSGGTTRWRQECCRSRTRSAFSKRWVGAGGHNAVTPAVFFSSPAFPSTVSRSPSPKVSFVCSFFCEVRRNAVQGLSADVTVSEAVNDTI